MDANKRFFAAGGAFLATSLACAASAAVFGNDDRLDLFEVVDARILGLADSTVLLVDAESLDESGEGMVLKTTPFSNVYLNAADAPDGNAVAPLCREEAFYGQPYPMGRFCSGFLVGPDLIATASHCIDAERCLNKKIVFGFSVREKGKASINLPKEDVYSCAEVVGRGERPWKHDWALIRLDRPVVNHAPLPINRSGYLPVGTPVFMIGHPDGLPTKVVGNAHVNYVVQTILAANLDAFEGSSGSPIFNAETGLVEGIMSRNPRSHYSVKSGESCASLTFYPDDGGPNGPDRDWGTSRAFMIWEIEDRIPPLPPRSTSQTTPAEMK